MSKAAYIWVLMAQPLVHWGNNLACITPGTYVYLCELQLQGISYMHGPNEGINLGSGNDVELQEA